MSKTSDAIGWGILGVILALAISFGWLLLVGWVATLLIWPIFGISLSIWQGFGLAVLLRLVFWAFSNGRGE